MSTHGNTGRIAAVEALPDPPRVAWRNEMRERVLDAAYELACAEGWDRVSMSAVASLARVSRRSVYKEFGSRARLGHALVTRETRLLLNDVAEALAATDRHPSAVLEAALLVVLTAAERHLLLRSVVTAARQGSDSLLPYLTARTDPLFAAAQGMFRVWFAERFPARGAEDVEVAADLVVRVAISHLFLPAWPPPATAGRLSRTALRVLGET